MWNCEVITPELEEVPRLVVSSYKSIHQMPNDANHISWPVTFLPPSLIRSLFSYQHDPSLGGKDIYSIQIQTRLLLSPPLYSTRLLAADAQRPGAYTLVITRFLLSYIVTYY